MNRPIEGTQSGDSLGTQIEPQTSFPLYFFRKEPNIIIIGGKKSQVDIKIK